MSDRNTLTSGKVYLVGAGPGASDLITVRGLRCLRVADVVLYDRLISQDLLDEARPGAELVYVGKEPNCHTLPQHEINQLLVSHARRGLVVVRLKGGDPFLFGRGGEEALELTRA
ncbi:MAG TPA: SAM-dependent methyltransferase, partial [Ktedonosporobacter sp.]|nr:SAM-dependent methyltransferase [Ktedonosporobacter sp.]